MTHTRFPLVIAVLAAATFAAASPFQNGSFESGPAITSGATLGAGDTSITGWTVGGNGIDYLGTYWQASNGIRSLDLSATDEGSISQTFDTVVGQSYLIHFDMAGNPLGGNRYKYVDVAVGANDDAFTFDTQGATTADMHWKTWTDQFVAVSTSTTLTFTSGEPNAYGPALDNVTVQVVPEPDTLAIVGLGALATIRRRWR